MPSEVESMMYVGKPPWHGLGVALDHPPTAREAITAAGLDWQVEKRPLFVANPKEFTPGEMHLRLAEGFHAVARTDTQRVLGVVGRNWKPLQNVDAFSFFDPFIAAQAAEYHTAGSLKNGQRVWVLAKLVGPPMEVAPGDTVERYLLLSNNHDGKAAINVRFTPVRVVCWNTLTMAEGDGNAPFLKIIHRGDLRETLEHVQEVVNLTHQTFATTFQQYRFLASRQVQNIEKYVRTVLGLPEEEEPERQSPAVSGVLQRWETGKGQMLPAIRGTYWAAYNAVTEWVDHERGRPASRVESAWYGQGRRVKQRALESAVQLSKAA